MKGTWQTTGGGGLGEGALMAVAVIIAAAFAAPILTALNNLLVTLAVITGVLVVLVTAGTIALLALRRRSSRLKVTADVSLTEPRPWRPVGARTRPVMTAEVLTPDVRSQRAVTADTDRVAIGPPVRPEVHTHIHVHLSGDPAADAATVRALTERNG